MNDLFTRLNGTETSAGEEVLYRLLRDPCFDPEVLGKRREWIELLRNNGEDRLKIQLILTKIGKRRGVNVTDYFFDIAPPPQWKTRIYKISDKEYQLPCSVCGAIAVTFKIDVDRWRNEDALIYTGITHQTGLDLNLATPLFALLEKEQIAEAHKLLFCSMLALADRWESVGIRRLENHVVDAFTCSVLYDK
jgi:hypothetical protein